MTKALLKKKISEETKNLSASALTEILDYIQSLKSSKLDKGSKESFAQTVETELSALDKTSLLHLEEEFSNYKELHPHEG